MTGGGADEAAPSRLRHQFYRGHVLSPWRALPQDASKCSARSAEYSRGVSGGGDLTETKLDVLGKSSFSLGRLRASLACALGSRQMPPSKKKPGGGSPAKRKKAASSSAAAGTSAGQSRSTSVLLREEPLFRPQAQTPNPAQEHKGCVQACVLARAPRQGLRSTRCRGFCQIERGAPCSDATLCCVSNTMRS